jgi:hypothetical protein
LNGSALLKSDCISIVEREFNRDPIAASLVARLLDSEEYSPEFTRDLAETATGNRQASWEVRRAAILMIEHQLLRLPPGDSSEAAAFLKSIGAGEHWDTLRQRLTRLNRVHRGICGARTSPVALADFLHTARQECKLTLARYFFRPQEVAARIVSQLRWSSGLPYWRVPQDRTNPPLTSYEKEILAELHLDGQIYWTNDQTPSAINSLVEYPHGTVVLIFKFPGSDCEFELKRGGIRGPEPLSVKYYRAAHRLYGGSPGTSNDPEARNALRLADIFRSVHGHNPQINSTLSMSYVQTVPGWRGEEHLLTYLTDPAAFGPGYRAMRAAMADAVHDFEATRPNRDLPGDIGLTVRFLRFMPPRQALLKGSTSFRLDLMDRYLSADGPREYFREGLHRDYSFEDARRFANDLLEEVLGVVEPPDDAPGAYTDYVRRALSVPANRERADRLYREHLRHTGLVWGTILAAGGYSRGESFVPRNVGLKSKWKNGEWTSEIIFMDHDCLRIPGGDFIFDPQRAMPGIELDEGYLFEDEVRGNGAPGVEGCLRRIYQVSQSVRAAGIEEFRTALVESYRKTGRGMTQDPHVRKLFVEGVAAAAELWDSLVRSLLDARRRGETVESWQVHGKALLEAAGQGPRIVEDWAHAAMRSVEFLARYDYLFDVK